MKFKPFTLMGPLPNTIPLTLTQALSLGLDASIHEKRGQWKTRGDWGFPTSYKALGISCEFAGFAKGYAYDSFTIYGEKTLSNAKESGYQLEGTVSINRKNVRGFTSSQLFELPNGHLISVATIHACLK